MIVDLITPRFSWLQFCAAFSGIQEMVQGVTSFCVKFSDCTEYSRRVFGDKFHWQLYPCDFADGLSHHGQNGRRQFCRVSVINIFRYGVVFGK